MLFKPITTEKAVRMIDLDNTLVFEIVRQADKEDVKKEFEQGFAVKVEKVRTNMRNNVKYAYIKLAKTHKAADLATKLGVI